MKFSFTVGNLGKFWVEQNGVQRGPIDALQLAEMVKSGELHEGDRVRLDGTEQWVPINHINVSTSENTFHAGGEFAAVRDASQIEHNPPIKQSPQMIGGSSGGGMGRVLALLGICIVLAIAGAILAMHFSGQQRPVPKPTPAISPQHAR